MITLGITGSIGMGKSTVVQLLRDRHIPVHDADHEAHALLAPHGKAVTDIAKAFPHSLALTSDQIPFIDRGKLANALQDTAQLHILESIIHPLVFAAIADFKNCMHQQKADIIALDIPLLFETHAEDTVDCVICVSAPNHIQKERVMARPGMTAEKFTAILAQQMPDAEKRARADYVLDNDDDINHLARQLDTILQTIRTSYVQDTSS